MVRPGLVLKACLACAVVLVSAQAHAADTFTATATVKGTGRSAPLTVTVKKYSNDGDRDALLAALKTGGHDAARALLSKKPDVGAVLFDGKTTPVKYAHDISVGPNRVITFVTVAPIHFVGGSGPNAKLKAGYDIGVIQIDLSATPGTGEIAPAAKIGAGKDEALIIEDYGASQIVLSNVVKQ